MANRDGYSNFRFFQAIAPSIKTAQAYTGNTIDRQGYDTCNFVVNVSTFSVSANISTYSAYFIRMQHAHGSLGEGVDCSGPDSTWSNVQASLMLFDITMSGVLTSGTTDNPLTLGTTTSTGSGANEGVFLHFGISQSNIQSAEAQTYTGGYRGKRRFVRLMMSCSAAADQSDVTLGAVCILGLPSDWPVNTINKGTWDADSN
jgi:hypothetical protein